MRRRTLVLAALALVSAAAAHAGPRPRVGIAGAWQSADSIRVTASWTEVRDARGGAVTYSWAFYADSGLVANGATTALSEGRTFARPLAGDTARYYAEVYAVDSRGKVSAIARSATLLVVTPWTPPPPPVIQIDTVAYDPAMPDTITFHVSPPTWGGPVRVGALSMGVGDTVTLCGVRWRDGYGERGVPITFASDQPGALLFEQRTPDCALLRTLAETSLGVAPYPTRVAGP